MQKTGTLGGRGIKPKLGGHDAAQLRDLLGVLQDVLTKRGAIAQSAERLDDLGVKVVDAGVKGGLLASLLNPLVYESLGLLVHLLDAGRVNAAVGDEVLERHAGRLATNGLEAREQHRLGGIIDDERRRRRPLERADVAALAGDDAALEVIGGDVNGGNGDLAGLVSGAALDGGRHDLSSRLVSLGTRTLLALAKDLGLLTNRVLANAVEKLLVGLVLREGRDALELGRLLLDEAIEVALATVELARLTGELVLATVERVVSTVEGLLALHDTALKGVKLALALLLLGLSGLALLEDVLLGSEDGLLLGGLGLTLGIGANLGSALCWASLT